MPQFILRIKADLENLRALYPVSGNLWKFDIQTPGGGEERKGITVSTEELISLTGTRGEANFAIKWQASSEQSYIKIIPHKEVASAYTSEDSGEFVAILALECRGIEVTKWYPSFDFDVETAGGFRYDHEKVDLSDREWAEYDEENDLSVSISNLEYRIE